MNIDNFIIVISFGEFCLFWVLHVILFRHVKPEFVINWLISIYLLVGVAGAVFSVSMFRQLTNTLIYQNLGQATFALTTIFVLFSLLVGIYTIGIFGVIESSVRIKLLSLIGIAKTRGLSEIEINKKYNKKSIIDKRLLRMCRSGELVLREGKYYIGRRWSLLSFITLISEFVNWLYS